ncbi:membrane integrity-associated transporter subunit PqiC [Bradyrhizobium lablabi]|uniref:ABC-type transport auxiliary lipoprotein family protein n=1 Tax=Bradyrhizobium lablabi TaxID=722472 RepID=UPI001BAC4EFD|nr:ABC-type transport auxiliary lipoprotein family protein [Bradyrhizobium lablabi]MBR1125170.1 membrane integrity-associated transporter subunit PqiC [Bradyrhizobium lablabi]
METRAPFIVVGAFVLAAIAAVFGFVYWLHNSTGIGARSTYHVQFDGSVPGLLVGASVLFNGIRVGEVTGLKLATDNPRRVNATIAVAADTPVRSDTKVGLDFQGLTGVPVVALEGGKEIAASGNVPTLIAEPGAGQSMTQAARDALRRVDSILSENAEPLQGMIANFRTFSDGLARNTGKLDSIVSGLERMTGASTPPPKTVYNLQAAPAPASPGKPLQGQLVIPEPSTVVMLDTQRILFSPANDSAEFANAQWADTIPRLLQAKLIQSFENYDIAHAPLRSADGVEMDYQLLLDIREFRVEAGSAPTAKIAFSARLLTRQGKVVAARVFSASQTVDRVDPSGVIAAFDTAFADVARELIAWTVQKL